MLLKSVFSVRARNSLPRLLFICTVSLVVCFLYIDFVLSNSYCFESKENDENSIIARLEGPLRADDPKLIDLIQRKYLKPPSVERYNLSVKSRYKVFATSMTWGFVHEKLKLLFQDEPPGFFIEAGALDGEYLSNSLWLEKDNNWTGILIEPDPINFSSLLRKHRKAWVINACLSTVPYPRSSIFSMSSPSKEQRMTYTEEVIWAYRGHTYRYIDGYSADGPLYEEHISIQCFPLESLLISLNISVVDFLSLDIQGGEWDVLKNFPWNKVKVRAMAVEYYIDNNNKTSPEFVRYFTEMGFKLIGTSYEPDYFFVDSNYEPWKNITAVSLET